MNKLKISLLASSIILLSNLAFWLINQSQMMLRFPLEGTDWATHIFELWALGEYGFKSTVPHWYNGYTLLEFYNPGWYFFSLPFLKLSGNVLVASFTSVVALLAIIFVGIYLLGKTEKLSNLEILAFFAFFAGNALAIANFIRIGRTPELAGWAAFVFLAVLLFYYKDKDLDYKFLLFIPLTSFLLLSHFVTSILFGIFLLGFFLIKSMKDKIYIIISGLVAIGLISFWLIPLLRGFNSTYVSTLSYSDRFYSLSLFDIGLNVILPLIMITFFVFYWKQNNYSKKELLFFGPVIAFAILLTLKLTPIIPILDRIYPGPTAIFFTFFTLYFLFKLEKKTSFSILLIILALSSVAINTVDTKPFPEATILQDELLSVIPEIGGRYMIIGDGSEFFNWAYAYAAIYHDKRSLWGGWQTTAYTSEYERSVDNTYTALRQANCEDFITGMINLNSKEVVGIKDMCTNLSSCGLNEKIATDNVCIYEIGI